MNFVVFAEVPRNIRAQQRELHWHSKLVQFPVRFIIQKSSKILGFNSLNIDTLIVQFSDEIKDTLSDSINRHTKLVCIILSIFHFFLMDIRIK